MPVKWEDATELDSGGVKIPANWLYLYYYEALNVLFRFENALRIFAYIILKKELGERWDSAAIASGGTIRSETNKRRTQARDHGYLGYEVTSPMLFLNSGELTQIITADAYWKHFSPYFKASKTIIQNKLNEIGTVRNSLAHFRPLKQDDLDLVKQNTRHVLLGIDACLAKITSISNIVPTNSDSEWYKRLSKISNDVIHTTLLQSQDGEWIRVQLSYQCPILYKSQHRSSFLSFQLGNFRTGELIKAYSEIRNRCIYVSEKPAHGQITPDFDLKCTKEVSLVFHRASLESSAEAIENELVKVAEVSLNESLLLQQDRLALGTLISSKSANASYGGQTNQQYWSVNVSSLNTATQEVENVEFWGQRYNFNNEFVTDTHHYPWMPSPVSLDDFPF